MAILLVGQVGGGWGSLGAGGMYVKGENPAMEGLGLRLWGFLARMGYSAERMDANMEALERGKRNPAPSTYTHDLPSLELRSGGRGLGQARAINTGRG